jgi:phenylacetate-coenzyme A ligase PaaK-like adenylate-forming protein
VEATAFHLDRILDLSLPGSGPLAPRLARARLDRLAATLRLAARESLFYRRRMGRLLAQGAERLAGLDQGRAGPGEAEGLMALVLRELPFTLPADLAAAPESFLAVPLDRVEGLTSLPSSGSRGPAKRVFSSAGDLENTLEFFRHGMREVLGTGETVALMMPGGRPGSVGDLLSRALARRGVPCRVLGFLPGSAGEMPAFLDALRAARPDCLVGLPSQLMFLARTAPRPEGLRTVLLSGEPAPGGLVSALAGLWRAEVFVHFGMTEFGLGGAVECRARQGPHLREADLLAEIVGPAGQPLSPGQTGEIVLTSLSREAMPLIRYRTGDLGTLLPGRCPCGSALRRLVVLGRADDRLALADGRPVGLWDVASALYGLDFVASFSASLLEAQRPLLTLRVGTAEEGPGQAARALQAARAVLGPGLDVRITLDPTAPPPAAGGAKPSLARTGRGAETKGIPASR